MAKSLFNVVMQNGTARNVLAQTGANGVTALQAAINAAVSAEGNGAIVQNAVQLQGKPIDFAINAAVSPATDGAPKAVFSVQLQMGTGPNGPNGTNVNPVLVLSNPQTTNGTTTDAATLAIQQAATTTGATPNAVVFVGQVDIDATA